jgi:hypothetical protein
MPAAASNPATCTTCGTTAPMHTFLMNEQGALTCASCLAKAEAQAGLRKRTKNTMLAPAMVSVMAYLSFVVPVFNIAAPGILAAIAMWSAIGGIRLHNEIGRRRDDHGVSPGLRSGLLVMSILTLVFASFPLLMQILAWVAMLLMPSHRGTSY